MNFAFWFSFSVCLIALGLFAEIASGARKIGRLSDAAPDFFSLTPKVSIIVPALNEAGTIEPALRSLLAIDYPVLEIIVVDDRSTDATPAILDRMAAENLQLSVTRISELPSGWLGKSHALHAGAAKAGGEYLIFTDADVVYAPDAISRAVAYCEKHGVHHLTLLFDLVARSSLLRMLMLGFALGFLARYKPWKVNTSRKYFAGIGAFNMVRADAYRAAGGHAAIPLEILDDMMLGRLMKQKGYCQHLLDGRGKITLEWYRTAWDMIRGMEKNAYAAFDYRFSQLLVVTGLIAVLRIWPFIGLFATSGAAQASNAVTLVVGMLFYIGALRASGGDYRCLIFAPVIGFVELGMWWRACLLTIWRGGVEWRGTRYSLKQLRQAHRRTLDAQ